MGGWLCSLVKTKSSSVPSTGIVALARQTNLLYSEHTKYLRAGINMCDVSFSL